MKTNVNKSAASAAFPSTRLAAPARSLAAARTRLAGNETRPAAEKRLKAVAPAEPARTKAHSKATRAVKGKDKAKARAASKKAPVAISARVGTSGKPVKSATRVEPVVRAEKPRSAGAARASVSAPVSTPKLSAVPAAKEPQPANELRTPPVVAPSAPATHTGRGDATLARYMSELASYELLGRDDEIRLAQEVEELEIAYWRALLSQPRAFASLEGVIRSKLEEQEEPTQLAAVSRASRAAKSPTAAKASRTRYTRAVERAAVQLRALDIHREAAKGTHEAVQHFADSAEATRNARTGGRAKWVDSYLHDIDVARRAQQAAKDRFVAANLRLVVSMARRYAREGRMPLADLIQEGNLGLMKAVERFDHRRGFRFSTYASWWIRHALTRGLADKGRLVRLPVHALETRTRLARATRKLTCRTGVAPTLAELAAETGLAPEKLTAVEELSTEAPFSLDAPMGGDNDRTFLDMLRYEDQTSAEETVVSESHKESLASLMGELSPFEAQILRYRYGFDGGEERTLKEIGQMYNLSRERIRQIQACALAKMRARAENVEAERAAL
jgi:RNA polymerase primary sigma factor